MYYQKDAQPELLKNKKIAVLGYGSQGHAHALNLHESGYDVVVGLRQDSSSVAKAEEAGLKVMSIADASKWADMIMILVPDTEQKKTYENDIAPGLEAGNMILFAHGFNIHFGQIEPRADLDVVLIAPKGPGDLVRRQYQQGRGVPCLIAVAQNATRKAKKKALAYAHGIGGTRGGVLETTFEEETVTDLFGEQVVLCGGATELVVKGFETLVEAGYKPEAAYYECLHELKLIVDLLQEGGITKMHEFISETAKWGAFVTGKRIVNTATKKEMKKVLKEIQDGKFARGWIRENKTGKKRYQKELNADIKHPIEKVGRQLRARMPWLEQGK